MTDMPEGPEIGEPTLVELEEEVLVVPVEVREPMVHQIGRQALGFAMAFMAERLANVTYDSLLKLYRMRKYKI